MEIAPNFVCILVWPIGGFVNQRGRSTIARSFGRFSRFGRFSALYTFSNHNTNYVDSGASLSDSDDDDEPNGFSNSE